jgi:hypothetical protein
MKVCLVPNMHRSILQSVSLDTDFSDQREEEEVAGIEAERMIDILNK